MAEIMADRKKLAIIDGKSVFYRGYYALPNLSTKEGVPTGGVYGFSAMALELIKKLKPDYVAVAWDKPKTNIRRRLKLYPDYKAGRKPAPPDFYTQIPILHELLEAFHWPLYELDDYEADDIMGALAEKARKKDIETQLITSDLDSLQLINGHVKVYALKKGFSNIEEFDTNSFEQKYGIRTDQFLDLKALKGDSSDNIPGVPGVGEKTALELLKEYETLDGVYENIDLIKETLRKKLEAGKKSAYMSKEIARLWTDAPVKLDLKAMDVTKIDTERLRDILQDLEFRSLLNNLPDHMQVAAPTKDKLHGLSIKTLPNHKIESDKDLPGVELGGQGNLFIHSRAAGKHGSNPQVLIIGDGQQSYTLNLEKLSPAAVKKALEPQLMNRSLIGYDIKSDIKLLINLDIASGPVAHDVLVAAYLINPLMRAQSLTDLATVNLRFEGSAIEDLPPEDFLERAPEILAIIQKLVDVQQHEFDEAPKIEKLAKTVEWPLIPVLAKMEHKGIKLDTGYLKKISKQLEDSITDLEQTIYGYADQEFNIGSPAQLAEVLFEQLNLPTQAIKKGKTGYSTAASELDKLRGQHPIIDLITQFREAMKLKNTYVDTLPEQVDGESRLHTTYNITIAPTGRLSSADPNLQAIPVRTELGRKIRTAFVAERGNVLVSADYSQFELRIAAALTGEQSMITAFNRDADIHVETAAQIYNIPVDKVTKAQRSSVKEVNFGIMYGLGPHALSQSTGMVFGEARDFIKRYFEIRPKLKQYITKTREQAEKKGYVETLLGRRRPTPDTHSSNFVVREAAFRAAVNMPFQGTAADIMKIAMIDVADKLDEFNKKNEQHLHLDAAQGSSEERAKRRGTTLSERKSVTDTAMRQEPAGANGFAGGQGKAVHMLLQIHDSLLVECPAGQAKKVGEILKDTMEHAYKLPVKLKVDISSGKNWGEL